MDESNTVVSAYTMYRHLQQYCSHPSVSFNSSDLLALEWQSEGHALVKRNYMDHIIPIG